MTNLQNTRLCSHLSNKLSPTTLKFLASPKNRTSYFHLPSVPSLLFLRQTNLHLRRRPKIWSLIERKLYLFWAPLSSLLPFAPSSPPETRQRGGWLPTAKFTLSQILRNRSISGPDLYKIVKCAFYNEQNHKLPFRRRGGGGGGGGRTFIAATASWIVILAWDL